MLRFLARSRLSLVLAIAALAWLPSAAQAAFVAPPNDGFVTDTAALLSEAQQADLELELNEYRQQTSNEIAVVTVQNLEGADIGQAALDIHRAWRVGSQTNDNGIVLLLAYEDRKVWISVGYGLEGAVPDLTAYRITEDVMKPLLKDGKYPEALQAGVQKLKEAIGGEYKPEAGAGGETDVFSLLVVTMFVALNLFRFFGAWMAKSKSWWHGGLIGLGAGAILAVVLQWWLPIPLLVASGFGLDYFVSRYGLGETRRRGSSWLVGPSGGWSSKGGGGGFSGFGGGSAGGGGGGSSW